MGDPSAKVLIEKLTLQWGNESGAPFRESTWRATKNNTLAMLRAQGYLSASWVSTQAVVDASAHTAALEGVIQSGPLFHFGAMQVIGLSRYSDQAIQNLSDLNVGTPYTEKRLLDYQENLIKLGLFESATVEIDQNPELAAASPVKVKVQEQALQQATVGFGVSDTSGIRTTLEYRHRRPFGLNWQSSQKIELGSALGVFGKRFNADSNRLLTSWETELISDPRTSQYRRLLSAGVSRLVNDGEITSTTRMRAGITLDTERIDRLIFAEWLGSSRKNASVSQRANAWSANYHWVWRDIDSVLLPTKGLTSSIQVGLGYSHSDFGRSGAFLRTYSRNTLYWPVAKKWYSQWRLELGQVFAAHEVGIPDALLFRAGGQDSVRGYGYRSLGVTNNGNIESGRTLFAARAELAHPFLDKQPNLWWAAFVDAGNASNQIRRISPALGYGLGVRLRSPVGPLNLDLAYGKRVHKARIHLSVGVTF
jgi:translocation and assembly module TamA